MNNARHRAARTAFALTTGAATIALAAGPAQSAVRTVQDPVGDAVLGSTVADITRVSANYGVKRIKIKVTFHGASQLAGVTNGGTKTSAVLTFKNGKEYTLDRTAADSAAGTGLSQGITKGDAQRPVTCAGFKTSVDAGTRSVTLSAPNKCLKGKGTKVKVYAQANGTSSLDWADTTKWIKQG